MDIKQSIIIAGSDNFLLKCSRSPCSVPTYYIYQPARLKDGERPVHVSSSVAVPELTWLILDITRFKELDETITILSTIIVA
jgi:hypothetical protein